MCVANVSVADLITRVCRRIQQLFSSAEQKVPTMDKFNLDLSLVACLGDARKTRASSC